MPNQAPSASFQSFIWNTPLHRQFLLWGGLLTIAGFIIFKILYPFPSLFPDSYFYMWDAATNASVGYRPIGYAWFLRFMRAIHPSGLLLIAVQYFVLLLGSWYFVFTLLYLFKPALWVKKLLFLFCIINPLYLYQSNLVSSDALFTGLSLLWLAALLWTLCRPGIGPVLFQVILLIIVFTIRYNAIYYPLLTVSVLLISRNTLPVKSAGILLATLGITSFVLFTREKNLQEIGIKQFSGFSGWQLCNNALYMYPHIQVDEQALPDTTVKAINRYVREFFDTLPKNITITPADGALFTDGRRPLKAYMFNFLARHPNRPEIWAYDVTSEPIKRYGQWLIRHYPLSYFRYFIWPNAGVYFIQPIEKLEKYNDGAGWYGPLAQQWFKYKSERVYGFNNQVQYTLMSGYIILFFLINVFFFLLQPLIWRYRKELFPEPGRWQLLLILTAAFAINAAFSILASPSVFRYQVFALVTGLFYLILVAGEFIPYMTKKGWF